MRALTFIILACSTCAALTALAAGDAPRHEKAGQYVGRTLELKGVRIGDPQSAVETGFGAKCKTERCTTPCKSFGGTNPTATPALPSDKETFASVPVCSYFFEIPDGKVAKMRIAFFPPKERSKNHYLLVFAALVEKFGPPQVEQPRQLGPLGVWKARNGSSLQIFPGPAGWDFFVDMKADERVTSATRAQKASVVNDM